VKYTSILKTVHVKGNIFSVGLTDQNYVFFLSRRNGLSTQTKQISFLENLADDIQISREEKAFRFWINSFDGSVYINNVFEDLRDGLVFLH